MTHTDASSPSSPSYTPLVVQHLPLIRHALDELGIRDVVNQYCPVDPRCLVSDGDCVAVMITNIMHGRVALYEMGDWLELTDVDLLLGEGTPVDAFNDDRLGYCLDRLFEAGTEFVFSEVARGVLARPEMGTSYTVNSDTTSVTLHGKYEEDPEQPWPETAPQPKRGYSKDHRPDLKQLIFGLSIHGPTRIPLNFSVLDGNTADPKANRFQIESLSQLLPPEHDVTLVADCKFVDAKTLGAARDAGFHYVSLLPRTFKLRASLIEELRLDGRPMEMVGRFAGRTKKAPERHYKANSVLRPLDVLDVKTGTLSQVVHRLLIVRSSTQEEEYDSTIERRVAKAADQLDKALLRLARRSFACERDLRSELDPLVAGAPYHHVKVQVDAIEVPRKRKQAGRPKTGEEPETDIVWRLVEHRLTQDTDKIAVERFHAAHFVLVTDHLDGAVWSDQRIFETWRSQQSIEGHAGFRWLKGVAEVAPVFLKLPHRIQALALVFMLALMVRNWLESTIRRLLATEGRKLPNFNDKLISRPTAENVLYLFRGITILKRTSGAGTVRREVHHLRSHAVEVLYLLGLDKRLFTKPPARKWGMVAAAMGET